jgi:cytochrome c-type biogenesis protein CcmH/NrfF
MRAAAIKASLAEKVGHHKKSRKKLLWLVPVLLIVGGVAAVLGQRKRFRR